MAGLRDRSVERSLLKVGVDSDDQAMFSYADAQDSDFMTEVTVEIDAHPRMALADGFDREKPRHRLITDEIPLRRSSAPAAVSAILMAHGLAPPPARRPRCR